MPLLDCDRVERRKSDSCHLSSCKRKQIRLTAMVQVDRCDGFVDGSFRPPLSLSAITACGRSQAIECDFEKEECL